MAEIIQLESSQSAVAVLGSCIGLALYDKKLKVASVAHIVLPSRDGRDGPDGKFVDSAVPAMIDSLKRRGATSGNLVAKAAGGASMFKNSGPLQVGAANAESLAALLSKEKIPLLSKDLGGNKGRRIVFDASTCEMQVDVAGEEKRTI